MENCGKWLLLLSSPPSKLSINDIDVAHGPSVTDVLQRASIESLETQKVPQLTLAIAISGHRSDFHSFDDFQSLFQAYYTLICIISSKLKIDVEFDNDVDVRLALFSDPTEQHSSRSSSPAGKIVSRFINLTTLAQRASIWSHICVSEDEAGERYLRKLQSYQIPQQTKVTRVPAGLSMLIEDNHEMKLPCDFPKCSSVAVGGTFDHLHLGHKLLLTMTILATKVTPRNDHAMDQSVITIGLTGDSLLAKKQFSEELQSWQIRRDTVREFLESLLDFLEPSVGSSSWQSPNKESQTQNDVVWHGNGLIIRYLVLQDAFGPTISDPEISALVVSAETRGGADTINDQRKDRNMKPLEIYPVSLLNLSAADDSEALQESDMKNKLSSTDIRRRLHNKRFNRRA